MSLVIGLVVAMAVGMRDREFGRTAMYTVGLQSIGYLVAYRALVAIGQQVELTELFKSHPQVVFSLVLLVLLTVKVSVFTPVALSGASFDYRTVLLGLASSWMVSSSLTLTEFMSQTEGLHIFSTIVAHEDPLPSTVFSFLVISMLVAQFIMTRRIYDSKKSKTQDSM